MAKPTIHPRKIAAAMSYSPKLAAQASGLTKAEVRSIRDLQDARRAAKGWRDPLTRAAISRPFRTPSAIRAATDELAARNARLQASIDAERRARDYADALRRTLILAARAARALGFSVRSSSGRHDLISSYYCTAACGAKLRISDHDIPATPQREFMARAHGRDTYDGYHGAQLIIDQPRRYEWLKRAIRLAAAGRM
jgi:hypothetical protein